MKLQRDTNFLFNHISIEQALRDFRLNTLIPNFNQLLNRTTSICLKKNYNSIDDIILVLNFDLIKQHYYLEEYNDNIYLVGQSIKELNQFLDKIMINDVVVEKHSEEYKEIKNYSDKTGISLIMFRGAV